MSRFEETLRTVPPTTLGVIGVCTLLYLVQIFADVPPLHSVTFSPSLVLYQGQVYRIVTSTVYHANFMHIGMNMMSTLAIGTMLEKRLGTLRLFCTILLSMAVSSVLYIAVALALDVGLERHGLMNQHSVGFSGVIFHWLVLECNLLTHESNRSVFGVVQVPAHLYPWVILVVLQVLVPGLSFMGHLSGIVAGTLQLYGCLDCIMPSETTLLRMDEWDSLHWLKMTPSFVATTNYSSLPMGATLLSLRGAVSTRLAPIAQRMQSAIPSSQSSVVGGVSGAGRTLGTRSDLQPLVSSQAEDGVPSEASRSPTSHVV